MSERKPVKIALGSDWHWGISKPQSIKSTATKLALESSDVILMAVDACGGKIGWKGIRQEVELLRELAPEVIIVYCLGNHDYWCRRDNYTPVTMKDFDDNIKHIRDIFAKHNIYSVDYDGILLLKDVIITGASGWYSHPCPATNDHKFLPKEMSNVKMLEMAEKNLEANLKKLDSMLALLEPMGSVPFTKVVFASHFPVIDIGTADWKGSFEEFSWSTSIGQMMTCKYNCQHFLCGHSHTRIEGIKGRYECGSDYYAPNWMIVEV